MEHYNFYGAVETGRIAWECAAHEGLHLNTDNVVIEFVPTHDGHDSESPGLGETVITTLSNEAMPFIRYRLGDISGYIDRPCSCGLPLPLISAPVGRTADLVELPSGRLLTARGLAALIRRQPGIRQLLITQTDRQHIEIQVVVDNRLADGIVGRLRSQLSEHLGEPIDLVVRVVDSIEQPGPKARDFVSLIR
jgi:phenylacetate-CoA ligase